MKSRHSRLIPLFLVAALLVPFTLGNKGCKDASGNNKYSPYAHAGLNGLKATRTILKANGISTARIDIAISVGETAVSAIDSGAANTIDLIAAFITAFDELANEMELIKDPRTRTIVMVALAVANVALHTLADMLKSQAGEMGIAKTGGPADKIAEFAARPKWRCRSSITGRFAKMEVCKAHPESTQVERR